jgi:hypothetical protein
LNIILVSDATARARTLTLDWRHGIIGGLALLVLFVGFTLAFNFVTLKYAAATQHPWLQAIVLADQRAEALRTQERSRGTSTRWRFALASCRRGCCASTVSATGWPRPRG